MDAADAEVNPNLWAAAMLRIAFVQEAVSHSGSQATLDRFQAALPVHSQEGRPPIGVFVALGAGLDDWASRAPLASRRMADLLFDLEQRLDDSPGATVPTAGLPYLAYADEPERLFDLLEQMDNDTFDVFLGVLVRAFVRQGNWSALERLQDLASHEAALRITDIIQFNLLELDDVTIAERFAAQIEPLDRRTAAYAAIARHLARLGEETAARAIVTTMREEGLITGDQNLAAVLADTFAFLGDEPLMRSFMLIVLTENPHYPPQWIHRLYAYTAAHSGDTAAARAYILNVLQPEPNPYDFRTAFSDIVYVHTLTGMTNLTPLINLIPPEHTLAGL